ncbi:hypothetical protein PR048_027516 [Dryococelus australis]|uniref:Uncharacterized protein n=1 Tax=Dryococelus australis TaxID=614101 RepID=A0ABQ9GGR0_9NEOP|nr:hypothetical protein PR048_027516 [Dryococelus australis]
MAQSNQTRAIERIYHRFPVGRGPPGRPRQRWKDNIVRDLSKLGRHRDRENIAQDWKSGEALLRRPKHYDCCWAIGNK